ncbi:hypothetical protein ACIHEI_30420 [Kitasatospora sp. NPDC051984]|uniref:hypothetical protein n=1 Tax=Kitasatospora sp. NPDC051984 TaxID=3364059 RepID=UPI0037C77A0C
MADQAKHTRRIFTGVDTTGAVPIEYRFSHARNGNRHLVVVFANFTAPDEYGWGNGVLDKVRGNILWIRDSFEGANSYYLCKRMDFSLEQSVAGVITRVMHSLHLTPQDVTVFGSSKGGSAALFYGLKYGFGNIVASVPQFNIGSYVLDGIPSAARLMMGEVTERNVAVLDAVLPDLVMASPHRNANIYLITSPQDEQYLRQVQPFVQLFQGYSNFNFIYNDSVLITGHGKVTLRNLPTLMGILNLLVDGVVPRIGLITNGGEVPEPDLAAIEQFLKDTSQVRGDSFPRPVITSPPAEAVLPPNGVAITGFAPGGVRVSIWENGKYVASAPVAADGSWSWQADRAFTAGRHLLRVFAADASNIQSERSDVVFTIDGQAPRTQHTITEAAPLLPAPVVTEPVDNSYVPGPVVRLSGHAPGAVRVDLAIGEHALGSAPVEDGLWTWQPEWEWRGGGHTVEVRAAYADGRVSGPGQVGFVVAGALARNPTLLQRYGG